MGVDLDTLLSVLDACDEAGECTPLISFVIRKNSGLYGQIFLEWVPGKPLRRYVKELAPTHVLTLYEAAYSHILDQTNVKRRLSYVPRAGDEIRFIKVNR